MVSGQDIVREARTWIGTPFHHAARVKGVGVDCAGLLVGVAHALGLPVQDDTRYHAQDNLARMRTALARECEIVPEEEDVFPGDVLLLIGRGMPNHLAIFNGNGGMIHAWRSAGGVVEHKIDEAWVDNVVDVYRLRGLS